MRLLAIAALACALGGSVAGCRTVYEPIVVEGRVIDGTMVPPRPGLGDAQRPAEPVPGEPGQFIIYRRYTTVDWDGIGHGVGRFFEGVGKGLLIAGAVTVEVLGHCATCWCR